MTPKQLRTRIASLPERAPITENFEAAITERRSRSKEAWYRSQKEHWLGWLKEYNGPGAYGRETWDVTAETVYNRVVNSAMVLYLGEAAGVPTATIKAAAAAALKAGNTMQAQSAAIRQLVPWVEIDRRLR